MAQRLNPMEATRRRILLLSVIALLIAVPAATASYHTGGGGGDVVDNGCETTTVYNPSSNVQADGTGEQAVHVDVIDFAPFDPAMLTVDEGTCVEWENQGTIAHKVVLVTSTAMPLDMTTVDEINPGDTTHYTFNQAGTYYVHCGVNVFHEATMHQAIRVV